MVIIICIYRRMFRSLHALRRVTRTNKLCEQIALGKAIANLRKLLAVCVWLYKLNTAYFFQQIDLLRIYLQIH